MSVLDLKRKLKQELLKRDQSHENLTNGQQDRKWQQDCKGQQDRKGQTKKEQLQKETNEYSKNMKKRISRFSAVFVISVLIAFLAVSMLTYYKAAPSVNEYLREGYSDKIVVTVSEKGDIYVMPQDAKAGYIFYPGARVQTQSYIPLAYKIAEQDVACVIIDMPFRFAFFDIDAADGIKEKYPEITDWYIGGHSLGGSMAALYLSNHADEYEGIILMGSYSTKDFSDTELKALSIYGANDGVLNRRLYSKNLSKLPANYAEYVIAGGCHSYFGKYGNQFGDGSASITRDEQMTWTAEKIGEFVSE